MRSANFWKIRKSQEERNWRKSMSSVAWNSTSHDRSRDNSWPKMRWARTLETSWDYRRLALPQGRYRPLSHQQQLFNRSSRPTRSCPNFTAALLDPYCLCGVLFSWQYSVCSAPERVGLQS